MGTLTLSAVLPYLLVAAGYAIRHFDLLGKLGSLVGLSISAAAGPNPASSASAGPAVSIGKHPILSDAVNAAIKQAVADVMAGHVASLRDELKSVAKAAADAAIADAKAKV